METILTGLTWQHPRGLSPLQASAEHYRAIAPRVQVRWRALEWYKFEAAVWQALESGSGEYDLVMLDHPWIGTFAARRWLTPFEADPAWKDAVVAPSLESYRYNGELWALPVDAACHVLAYRRDRLRLTGEEVPGNWAETLALGRRLYDPPTHYGLGFSFAGVQGFLLFLSIAASYGCRPYAQPEVRVHPEREMLDGLNLLRDLAEISHPSSLLWSPPDLLEHLATADDTVLCPSVFGYVNYAQAATGRRALDFALPPGARPGLPPRPILGGVGVAVAVASRNREQALRYARFVLSREVQVKIFPANEGQPGLLAAWTDVMVRATTGSFYPAMLEAMSTAYTRPRFPGWMRIELDSGKVVTEFLQGRIGAQAAIEALERIRQESLGELYPIGGIYP